MPQNHQRFEAEESQGQHTTSRHLLEVAWYRKGLVILGVVVGLVVGVLYFAQARRIYESTAQVHVVKKRPDTVTGLDTRHLMIEDYVATHQTLIKSPLIVEGAIRKRDLANLGSLANEIDLTETIIKSLTVTRNKAAGVSNNVLNLAYAGTDSFDARSVLNAIIASYKDYLDETFRNISEDTLKLIVEARDVLKKELASQEDAFRNFRKNTPLLFWKGKDGGNLKQERLSTIEAKLSALLIRKAEMQSYLHGMDGALKSGGSREAVLAMASEWANRPESEINRWKLPIQAQEQLYVLLMEEQRLLETKGAKHQEVEALRKRIELARDFLASPLGPWQQDAAKKGPGIVLASTSTTSLDSIRDYFKQQLQYIEVAEKQLQDLLKEEHEGARELTRYEIEEESFRTDILRTQKLYDGIIKRLQEVDLIKDMGGYDANAIAPARPGVMVRPKGFMVFPVALFLGLIGGVGLAYLAEVMDKSFRSVAEVRRQLGLPIMGQIPYLKAVVQATPQGLEAGPRLDPMLCSHFNPKSIEAESYRGVRTALYFNTHGEAHKVIQITSPNSGDGKSTLAANLAISVAQSGKRVLLIDADLRKPRMHKLFGLSPTVGLGSIIAENVEPKDAIKDSGVPGLSLLPCGPIPPNPADLLTSPRFQELLGHLREQFDFVIVDTPPLLAVTDPSVVAARVDGVLLNVRLTTNARPAALRAKEILDTLGVRLMGVVVNNADQRANSEGFGYGYGYGYGNAAYAAADEPETISKTA